MGFCLFRVPGSRLGNRIFGLGLDFCAVGCFLFLQTARVIAEWEPRKGRVHARITEKGQEPEQRGPFVLWIFSCRQRGLYIHSIVSCRSYVSLITTTIFFLATIVVAFPCNLRQNCQSQFLFGTDIDNDQKIPIKGGLLLKECLRFLDWYGICMPVRVSLPSCISSLGAHRYDSGAMQPTTETSEAESKTIEES